jgi:hypothetical protein
MSAVPTWDLHTLPLVYAADLPSCVGACNQGRQPCRHPLACSTRCHDDDERADVAAELTTDREPLTRAEMFDALEAVLEAEPGGYPVAWWAAMVLLAVIALVISVLPPAP